MICPECEALRSQAAEAELRREQDQVLIEHYRALGVEAALECVKLRKACVALHQEILRLKATS